MLVEYSGTKPGNFEQADKVVLIGRYQNGIFSADQLLVKCPSKYQGTSAADSTQMQHPESIPKEPL
jgi:cytochrome c-type biogenesis protein CcmE